MNRVLATLFYVEPIKRFMEVKPTVTDSKQARFLKVKDKAGNEFLCPLDALKSVKDATDEELENCVEKAVVGRYAGDIEVVK